MMPGLMTPGHLASMGTRKPPSYTVPFSPRNGWLPPSGQLKISAPLSLVNSTIVLSAMPSASSLASNSPTTQSSSAIASANKPKPVLPSHCLDRCVKEWHRVELCQRKNGLSRLHRAVDKIARALHQICIDVFHTHFGSGIHARMRRQGACVRDSSACRRGPSADLPSDHQRRSQCCWMMLRGPNLARNFSSLGYSGS